MTTAPAACWAVFNRPDAAPACTAAMRISTSPVSGGALPAHGTGRDELEARVTPDPFVFDGMASAAVIETVPSTLDPRLGFPKPH